MEGYSQTPQEERKNALKSIMPEIFDEGKIDWEKLRETNKKENSHLMTFKTFQCPTLVLKCSNCLTAISSNGIT